MVDVPTFRVFVSSTFEDLQDERDLLTSDVFPSLERFCASHGARFQAVDLRWGIREQAGLDQKTIDICLAEIDRCLQSGIKPNFLILLGDRYGWRPVRSRIEQSEFESVVAQIPGDNERTFVNGWFKLDRNAVPPEYVLNARHAPFDDPGRWRSIEQALHDLMATAAKRAGLPPGRALLYEASATHREILEGLGQDEDARQHVFAFCRESSTPDDPSLHALKQFLKGALPAGNVRTFSPARLDEWIGEVTECLQDTLTASLGCLAPLTEIEQHQRVRDGLAQHCAGREEVLAAIDGYLADDHRTPCLIHGPSGSGKSTLIAVVAKQRGGITRFVGATPDASTAIGLVRSLCREIGERYALAGELPDTLAELAAVLLRRLALGTEAAPLEVFVDAIDQLPDEDGTSASWLPRMLPEHCRLVLSTTTVTPALAWCHAIEVGELNDEAAAAAVLNAWLSDTGRTLQPGQLALVLGRFRESRLPLYLKLAFEEARLWRSFDPPERCQLNTSIDGLVDQLFERLADPANHGEVFVQRVLGYLVASRRGLIEDELLAVLAEDDVVWDDLASHTRKYQLEMPHRRIPPIIWSRLLFDIEPYIARRTVAGGVALALQHQHLERGVRRFGQSPELFHRDAQRALAGYFGRQPLSPRKVDELPWLYGELSDWDGMLAALGDFSFLATLLDVNAFDARVQWARLESHSSHRVRDAYGSLDEGPEALADAAPSSIFAFGNFLLGWHDTALATSIFRYLALRAQRGGDRRLLAQCLGKLAQLEAPLHPGDAIRLYARQEQIARGLNDKLLLQQALRGKIMGFRLTDAMSEEEAVHLERISLCRSNHDLENLQNALGDYACYLGELERQDEALRLHAEEETICRQLGHLEGLCICLTNQARWYFDLERHAEAAAKAAEAGAIGRRIGYRATILNSIYMQLLVGDHTTDSKLKLIAEAASLIAESDDPSLRAELLVRKAGILVGVDRTQAESLAAEAFELASRHGLKDMAQNALAVFHECRR